MKGADSMEDSHRKLHQVLYNYNAKHRSMPTWNMLMRSTGKSKDQLQRVLDAMQAVGLLEWLESNPATIKLLQLPGQRVKNEADGQRYFTEY